MKHFLVFLSNNFLYIIFASLFIAVYFRKRKRDEQQKVALKLIDKAIKAGTFEPITMHPEIDESKCAGCAACTVVCPEGDILQMVDHKAVLVAPTKCVGHGACEIACPVDAIKLVFGTKTRGMDIPRLNSNYETNVPGLYIAGELGGMGLIRNAVKQGILAAQDAIKKLPNVKTDVDLLIVGAGPAGFSAGLTCVAQKISYMCIDQNTLGGAIFHYPRQKVVMSHPLEFPIVGKKTFQANKITKEELLGYWDQVRKKVGLKIHDQTKFETLTSKGSYFEVVTSKGPVTAKKVLLCLGVRGTPRKLGVPGEDTAKVTYNLLDPEQYQKMNIAVVGSGNAGLEAAQMLGNPKWKNKVTLLVRGASMDRANQENIDKVNSMASKGYIDIWYNATIQEIHEAEIRVKKDEQDLILQNSFVFIFAGAEMPHKFLMSLGVQIDKKFAEGLSG